MSELQDLIASYTSQSELSNLLESDKFKLYSALSYATGDGVTNDYDKLYALINTTINGDDATIFFPEGTYILGSNLTIPSNIKITALKGSTIKGSDGTETITLDGIEIDAGRYQIFENIIVDGNITNEYVLFDWFGADSTGVSDSASSILFALNSLDNEYYSFSTGTYIVDNLEVPATKDLKIKGDTTILKTSDASNNTIFNKTTRKYIEIRGITFDSCKYGLKIVVATSASTAYDYKIKDCRFTNIDSTGYGIYLDGCREGFVIECYALLSNFAYHVRCVNPVFENIFVQGGGYGINGDGDDTPFSTGARVQNTTMLGVKNGLIFKGSDDGTLIGCMIDYCENPVLLDSQDNLKISDSYLSTNGTNNKPVIKIQNSLASVPRGIKISTTNIVQRGTGTNYCIEIDAEIKDSELAYNYINFYTKAGIKYKPSTTEIFKIIGNTFSGTGALSRSCLESDGTSNSANYFIDNTCNDEMVDQNHLIFNKDNRITSGFKVYELKGTATMLSGNDTVAITFPETFWATPHHVLLSGTGLNLSFSSLSTTGMTVTATANADSDTTIYYHVRHLSCIVS